MHVAVSLTGSLGTELVELIFISRSFHVYSYFANLATFSLLRHKSTLQTLDYFDYLFTSR
jgi:hypothetical protein